MNRMNIMDFGAVANSKEVQTAAIQAAIDKADERCGTVYIPCGEFVTGTLNLKSASLYLEKGAVLKGSDRFEDYVWNGYHHNEMGDVFSLIYSVDGKNITISGEGTIDLNGSSFFDFNTYNIPESFVSKITESQKEEVTAYYKVRPNQPIFFYNCENIKISDITILDASCWTLSFVECIKIKIDGITNIGHPRVPNNDGMHFSSCKKVMVCNCDITSADDCIALSAITDWEKPCEDVVISNCILKSFSKAIVLGYMHSVIRNVTISNCVIKESNRGICFMACSKSGLVENVTISNMVLDTEVRAGNWWGNGEPIMMMATYHHNYTAQIPDRNFDCSIRNVQFSNIVCTAENAIGIVGENKNIDHVTFNDVFVQMKPSRNLSLKGRIVDIAPSKQIDTIPQDGKEYFMHIQSAGNIVLNNVRGVDTKGEPAPLSRIE